MPDHFGARFFADSVVNQWWEILQKEKRPPGAAKQHKGNRQQ